MKFGCGGDPFLAFPPFLTPYPQDWDFCFVSHMWIEGRSTGVMFCPSMGQGEARSCAALALVLFSSFAVVPLFGQRSPSGGV